MSVGILLTATGLFVVGWCLGGVLIRRHAEYRRRFDEAVAMNVMSLPMSLSSDDVFRLSLICAGMGALLGVLLVGRWTFSMLAGAWCLGGIGFAVPIVVLKVMAYRRRERFIQQIPDAVEMMCKALDSGAAQLQQAMELVAREMPAPVSEEFGHCLSPLAKGLNVSLEDSADLLTKRMPAAETEMFIMVLRMAGKAGGAEVSLPLRNLGRTLRDRLNMERKVKSLTSQIRMQAIITALAPAFLFLAMTVTAPEMTRPFLERGAGPLVLVVVIILESIGGLVMWKMSKIEY